MPALRRAVAQLRAARGETVALVPTMGALHAGHLALVRLARRRARRVIVSIFVNPAQFAPNEDFASYPRSLRRRCRGAAQAGVDLVWAPAVETMYPPGFATRIVPEGPAKVGLEDAFRPHFFAGVATVVAKLLIQCTPDIAVFGEKDYQQLKVITQAGRRSRPAGQDRRRADRARTRRPRDVVAQRLPVDQPSARPRRRSIACSRSAPRRIARGEQIARVLDEGGAAIERAGFTLDYLEARHAETLAQGRVGGKTARSASWSRPARPDAADRQRRGVASA